MGGKEIYDVILGQVSTSVFFYVSAAALGNSSRGPGASAPALTLSLLVPLKQLQPGTFEPCLYSCQAWRTVKLSFELPGPRLQTSAEIGARVWTDNRCEAELVCRSIPYAG